MYWGYKPYTLAGDRSDHLLLFAGIADGAPSRIDPAAERGLRDDPTLPNSSEQIVLGNDPVPVLDEVDENVEDLGLYMDDFFL
jgi:hypothetical protein